MRVAAVATGLMLAFATPAFFALADDAVRRDAERVVALTYSDAIFEAQAGAMSSIIRDAMIAEASRNGLSISDAAASTLTEMMVPRLVTDLGVGMRSELTALYLDALSPGSLAGYRAFLESPAGQEFLAALPQITATSAVIGEQVGADIAEALIEALIEDMANHNWPVNTTPATKRELRGMFGIE
jgi:hypothetical protein